HWLDCPNHKRVCNHQQCEYYSRRRKDNLDTVGVEPRADGTLRAVKGYQHDSCHQRGDRERHVYESVKQPLTWKVEPHKHIGGKRPHHCVDDRDDNRGGQCQLESGESRWVSHVFPKGGQSTGKSGLDDRGQWERYNEAEIQDRREPQSPPSPWQR